jgi:hypothetical protein
MAQVNDRYQESRDIWNDYNSRQEFEHDLINRKTTWWLTTQTILFAAYGVTLTIQFRSLAEFRNSPEFRAVTEFRNVIAGVGLAVAVVTLIGVLALIRSKYRSWAMYQDFYRRFTWYSPPTFERRAASMGCPYQQHVVHAPAGFCAPSCFWRGVAVCSGSLRLFPCPLSKLLGVSSRAPGLSGAGVCVYVACPTTSAQSASWWSDGTIDWRTRSPSWRARCSAPSCGSSFTPTAALRPTGKVAGCRR